MNRIVKLGLLLALVLGLSVSLASAADNMKGMNMPSVPGKVTAGPGICPVLGGPASPKYSYQYKGKTYYFCCPSCITDFKKNPDKYISKIKEFAVVSKKYEFVPAEIRVKQGDIVKITLTSLDDAHGLAIKEYGVNIKAKKGEVGKAEFQADKKGTFTFRCSVYCGPGHERMTGKLIVE